MILLLDIGNSRLKWAIFDAGILRPGSAISHQLENAIAELESQVAGNNITRVVVANVAGERLECRVRQWVDTCWGLAAEFISAQASLFGLRNGYKHPDKLGVDRWLAMLAAQHNAAGSPFLLADCGSAITIDLVDAEGLHLGGVITPGLTLMKDSLLRGTALSVSQQSLPASQLMWSDNTEDAMRGGARLAAVGAIIVAIEQARKLFGSKVKIYLTGGDAELLKESLPVSISHDPWLVLKGLAMVSKKEGLTAPIELRSL